MSFFVPPPEADDPMSGIFGRMNNEVLISFISLRYHILFYRIITHHILFQSNDLPELLPEEDEEEMNRLMLKSLENIMTNLAKSADNEHDGDIEHMRIMMIKLVMII